MRNFFGLAILGCAMLAVTPAGATTSNFDFLTCSGSGSTRCADDLTSYGAVTSTTGSGVTATVTAYYVQGTSATSSSTPSGTLTSGLVGSYANPYGLGVCETQAQVNAGDCSDPTHQIDNGVNPDSGTTNTDFEFLLIQFSAAVNLSEVQLGNFSGGSSDPFGVTYFTSSATVGSITGLGTMTYSQLTGGADGFAEAQTSCSVGSTLVDPVQSLTTSNCANGGEAIDGVSGNNVTYLLIGASVSQAGSDYFKLQDVEASGSGSGGTSPTPEPATFGLLGLALTGLGIYGRKRRKS